MKFEKLNDAKIKIILSLKDIELNNISIQNLFTNSDSSQELLQKILNMAKEEIGFDAGDSKLLVEAIMLSDEECTFTITKLYDELASSNKNNNFIFKFDKFDNFIDLCTFLNNFSDLNLKDFSKSFSLILYNNTYYLYNFNVETYAVLLDYMREIFSEFGTNVSDSKIIDGILNEYGKVIFAKNAIVNCIYSFI